jgi:hypothetical protein
MLAPAWAGPVYNVTELHIVSGSSLDSADLARMFYAGFQYAPDGQGMDLASLNGAGLPIPLFPQDDAGPEALVFPASIGADAIGWEADSGDRLFPLNALLAGDTERVLYTPGFTRRDASVFTPAGQVLRVPCERGPSGLAVTLCPPPEHPEAARLSFRCALYTQSDAPPDYFCASPTD